jgi:hypothetical protein
MLAPRWFVKKEVISSQFSVSSFKIPADDLAEDDA